MPLTTLDLTVDVPADRNVRLELPAAVPPGRVRVIALVEEAVASATVQPVGGRLTDPAEAARDRLAAGLPVIPVVDSDLGADWLPTDTMRREEMYDDDGR